MRKYSLLLLGMSMAWSIAAAAQDATDPLARVNAWFDAKYEEQLDLSPMARGFAGDKKDHDEIDDLSEAAAADADVEFPVRLPRDEY